MSRLASWLQVDAASPFSLANIPFGIISRTTGGTRSAAVAIGEFAIDLRELVNGGAFALLHVEQDNLHVLKHDTLNEFASLGQLSHEKFRKYIQDLLRCDTPYPQLLRDNEELRRGAIIGRAEVQNHLPLHIGDYTDFYASLNHAYNVGVLFRGKDNALQPNYKHLPVGYHGRASSVMVSGQPVQRPNGQILPAPGAKNPIYSACKKLDMEVELAAFVCGGNEIGCPISIAEASRHIFGYVLMNDWSARDIQAWEYVPLGPFNSKNFATTISPWVVLAGALEPFRIANMRRQDDDTAVLPYLREDGDTGFDIDIKVELKTSTGRHEISRTNASNLLYSFNQMIAHHTSTGCNMRSGDLLGSGTISGDSVGSFGSFLEITQNGKVPIALGNDSSRTFLEDRDELIMTGVAGGENGYVGFGECRGKVVAARQIPF